MASTRSPTDNPPGGGGAGVDAVEIGRTTDAERPASSVTLRTNRVPAGRSCRILAPMVTRSRSSSVSADTPRPEIRRKLPDPVSALPALIRVPPRIEMSSESAR